MPWKEMNVMNQRLEFVMRALAKENFRALCREYGISAKSGYKWVERYEHAWRSAVHLIGRGQSSDQSDLAVE